MEAGVLREGKVTFSLDLHPAYSNNALQGVQQQLDSRLLRWDDGLGGVLLAYKNLQRLPAQAVIRPYFPYIQLDVSADVLTFKPSIGAVLCGQVTKLGADFIGMIIMGSINAAVGRQNIRRDLRYKAQDGYWECLSNPLGKIQLGSDVLFSVDGLRIEPSGVLAVLGSMKQPWAGATREAASTRPGAFPNPVRWQNLATGADPDGVTSTPGLPGRLQSPVGTPAEQPLLSPAGQPQSTQQQQQQQQGTDPIASGSPGTSAKPASDKHQAKQNGPLKNDIISQQGAADQPSKVTKKRKNGQANDVLTHVSQPPAGMHEDCTLSEQPTKRKKHKHKFGDSAANQPEPHLPAEQLPEQPRNGERLLHRSPTAAGTPSSPDSGLTSAGGRLPAGHQKQKKEKKKKKLKDKALPGSLGKQANDFGSLSAPASRPVREENLERKKKKKDKKNRVVSPHRTV